MKHLNFVQLLTIEPKFCLKTNQFWQLASFFHKKWLINELKQISSWNKRRERERERAPERKDVTTPFNYLKTFNLGCILYQT